MHISTYLVVGVSAMVAGVVPVALPSPGLCLLAPVQAPIVVFFRSPDCTYCSGQRGIEYAVGSAAAVHAAAAGVVTFSGVVAGTRYVVAAVGGDALVTYGMLTDSPLHSGAEVRAGQLIGHAGPRLYFGVRRAGAYVDPVPLLAVVRFRVRLAPTDGRRSRAARARPPSCPTVARTPWRLR